MPMHRTPGPRRPVSAVHDTDNFPARYRLSAENCRRREDAALGMHRVPPDWAPENKNAPSWPAAFSVAEGQGLRPLPRFTRIYSSSRLERS
jgi:hypothetical protein